MLLYLIFLQYIRITLANSALLSNATIKRLEGADKVSIFSDRRQDDYSIKNPTCEEKRDSSLSPFVAIVLYKSSGQYLGLGAIIDKKTVLTTIDVVKISLRHPRNLLILTGSRSPWWGRWSQVIRVTDILHNDIGLVVVLLKNSLKWNKDTKPIRIPALPVPPKYEEQYGTIWGIFGIPRSSWDIPGERTQKGAVYQIRGELMTLKPEHVGACKKTYPEIEFNETVMQCMYANASFCWGTIGSPIVALGDSDNVVLIASVLKTTTVEADDYHIVVKLTYFEQWISSYSAYSFLRKSEF